MHSTPLKEEMNTRGALCGQGSSDTQAPGECQAGKGRWQRKEAKLPSAEPRGRGCGTDGGRAAAGGDALSCVKFGPGRIVVSSSEGSSGQVAGLQAPPSRPITTLKTLGSDSARTQAPCLLPAHPFQQAEAGMGPLAWAALLEQLRGAMRRGRDEGRLPGDGANCKASPPRAC